MQVTIPTRLYPPHAHTEVLKPDLATMEHVFQGMARSDMSDAQRRSLSSLEADLARAQQLREQLRVDGAVIAGGDASPEVLANAAASTSDLARVEADLHGIVDAEHQNNKARVERHERFGPMTVFESGGRIHADLRWINHKVSPELAAQGVQGIKYDLQRPLGEAFFDLCAEPVGVQGKENLTFLRIDLRDTSEEMQLCPADQPLRRTELAPLGAGGGELYQHEVDNANLDHLTRFQELFARQVLLDLGMAWPALAPCLHCH